MTEINDNVTHVNTEQTIRKCAEEVFIERGFEGAKTTEIARRAGVNHAMLHYYFRTKQNLFNVVFQDKIALLASSFADSMTKDLPFLDKIKLAVETHFDFISENPRLLFFLYTEIVNNDERKSLLINNVLPQAEILFREMTNGVEEEVAKGTIRKVSALEILLNIISLNVTTFLALPLIEFLAGGKENIEQFMAERKANNVETILNSLRLNAPKVNYTQTTLDFGF